MANAGKPRLRATAIVVGTAAVAAVLIAWFRPQGVPVQPGDPTSAIVVASCWLAWLAAAYLSLAAAVASLVHLPGLLGRLGAAAAPLVPASMRRAVRVGVGVAVASSALAGPAAAASPSPVPPSPAPSVALSLEWPGLAVAATEEIVVRRGDSLWAISARLLGARSTTREVAGLWPRLYATNRAVIGSDPDLIQPGQHLRAPTPQERTPR
jgi:hypothetical protein